MSSRYSVDNSIDWYLHFLNIDDSSGGNNRLNLTKSIRLWEHVSTQFYPKR